MVNIIAMRQEERRRKINEIRESIKKADSPDEEEIVMATMSNLGLARRTAQEYVKIALWEIAHGK